MDDNESRELDDITLHHQADVGRLWELLMQPLGFGSRSIWLTFVDPDRRPVRSVTEIAECDALPRERDVDNLFTMLGELIGQQGEGFSVAFLVTRPGRHGLSADDLALGRLLVEGARRHGVPLEPLHLANDDAVLALAADDLAA